MSGVWRMAWAYVTYHRMKSAILVAGLSLTIVLPLTAQALVQHYDRAMRARATATPLVLGAKGNRFDLVLKALYFSDVELDPVTMAEVERIRGLEHVNVTAIPLQQEYTARGYPIVGTSLAYLDYRGLSVARGRLPTRLGQALLGSEVAAELELAPGDALFSDQKSLYDMTKTYPLKMEIAGVLAPHQSPDDRAVFVDVKTAWIIAGLTHGHHDVVRQPDPDVVLSRSETEVKTNASIVEYNEVTAQNIHTFHTHAAPSELPLTAVLVLPADDKSATIFRGYYEGNPDTLYQVLLPSEVVAQLMERVLEVKRVFDASFALVALTTGLFVILVVLLSRRLRRGEMETLFRIGCSRLTTFWLQAAELVILLGISVIIAAGLSAGLMWAAPQMLWRV